jgi:hypothetical protein
VIAPLKLWIDNEAVLLHKTGLNQEELKYVWSMVGGALAIHYEQHHSERKPPLMPFESLLVTLYWLRVYPTTRCMAAEFNVAQPNILEILNHTLDTLFCTIVPDCFNYEQALPPAIHSGTLAGVGAIVDSTFWVLPHTSKRDDGKKNWHYKSGTRQALKWQLCVTPDGVPYHISDVVHGSKHDVKLLDKSDAMDPLALCTLMLGDKGYIGASRMVTPKKKPRGAELEDEDKELNKEKNSARAVVENSLHQFKRWAILGGEYRGKWRKDENLQKANKIVHVIGAMVKRYIIAHPLRA